MEFIVDKEQEDGFDQQRSLTHRGTWSGTHIPNPKFSTSGGHPSL